MRSIAIKRISAVAANHHQRGNFLPSSWAFYGFQPFLPTNGLVAVMFGTKYLGMLGGIVFLSHQIGSFLGVWLGGYLFDVYGNFDVVWWLGVALGIFAAIIHWPIKERAVVRMANT